MTASWRSIQNRHRPVVTIAARHLGEHARRLLWERPRVDLFPPIDPELTVATIEKLNSLFCPQQMHAAPVATIAGVDLEIRSSAR